MVGVLIVWTRAPPSDHDENTQLVPAAACGDTASILRWMPTTPTKLCGVDTGWPSSLSCRPVGFVASVTVALARPDVATDRTREPNRIAHPEMDAIENVGGGLAGHGNRERTGLGAR